LFGIFRSLGFVAREETRITNLAIMSTSAIAQDRNDLPSRRYESVFDGPDAGDEVARRGGAEEEAVGEDEMAGHGDRFGVRYTTAHTQGEEGDERGQASRNVAGGLEKRKEDGGGGGK
jgi:hypothetical protein